MLVQPGLRPGHDRRGEGGDLAFPEVAGPRSAKVRLVNAYLPRLHAAAVRDEALATAMIRVIGLKDRPAGLLPDRVLRVLRGNLGHGRRPLADQAATIATSEAGGAPARDARAGLGRQP